MTRRVCPARRAALPQGDWRKRVIGRLIRRHTTVPLGWLAMGVPTLVSALLRGEPSPPAWGADWKAARKLLGELEGKWKKLTAPNGANLEHLIGARCHLVKHFKIARATAALPSLCISLACTGEPPMPPLCAKALLK